MTTHTQGTTLGEIIYKPIKGTVLIVINGLWSNGDLPITFYTSEDRTSGVIATYNAKTNTLVKMERIKWYGGKRHSGIYPIYKSY